MTAEIISIGTELLLGHIVNTNTAFLSRKLAEAGIDLFNTSVVGDNSKRLACALNLALTRADVIITTGGLGPTVDDITIETIADLTGKPLVQNKMVRKCLENYFKFKRLKMPETTMRQTYTPKGVRCVRNKVGTAPGLIAEWKNKVIICLPGPPRELEPMFSADILPFLKNRSKNSCVIKSRTIKITGLPESVVNNMVKGLLEMKPPTTVGIYSKPGQVELKIMSKAGNEKTAAAAIGRIEKKIRARLKNFIFGCDEQTLEGALGNILIKEKLTIAIAESCTGGLLADRITDVSGSSKYFIMGLVAYSNVVKENILGISGGILKKNGAVSREVALEMARRIKLLAGADIGVGITGIAGPGGGTNTKSVGLVYISIVTKKKKMVKELLFKGSREEIKFQATQVALDLVRRLFY